jgi:two-component system, NtrC family, response regulator AtoC
MAEARPKVLVVDDDPDVLDLVGVWLASMGYAAVLAAGGAAAVKQINGGTEFRLALIDVQMPEVPGIDVLDALMRQPSPPPAIMMTVHTSIEGAVQAMRRGAKGYLPKPFDAVKLEATVESALRAAPTFSGPIATAGPRGRSPIVGSAAKVQEMMTLVDRVTSSGVPVLVVGESGCGKELVARAIHERGSRAAHPFVAVNCAAIPADLLESELFGHERGAFTGAHQRRVGKMEHAGRGTLMLDEIGEMDARMQAKLLRVLQEREFERVGANSTQPLRARIVAATNRNLESDIAAGTFREDLFYRLDVFRIVVPPLRERTSDIPTLADHFLGKARESEGRGPTSISDAAMNRLRTYSWPGNVRELENTMLRASLVATGNTITPADLPPKVLKGAPAVPRDAAPAHELSLEANAQTLMRAALDATDWNIDAAAEKLGISRATLYRRIKRLGVTRDV